MRKNVMRRRRALFDLSLLCLLSLPAYAQEAPSARTPSQLSRLQSRLQELSDAFPGVIGVAVRDLKTGEELSINRRLHGRQADRARRGRRAHGTSDARGL